MFSNYFYDTLRYDMIWLFGQTDTVDGSGGQSLGSRSVGNLDGGNTLSECENPKVSTSTYSDSFSLVLSPIFVPLSLFFSLSPSAFFRHFLEFLSFRAPGTLGTRRLTHTQGVMTSTQVINLE